MTDNLERVESLLTETVKLFTANLGAALKTEVTERQDPPYNENAISMETFAQHFIRQMRQAGTK